MKKTFLNICIAIILSVLALSTINQDVAYALSDEHRLINEVWRIVDRAYVDDTFNNQNWWKVRQQALKTPLPNREAAYDVIDEMLASLEDPFTRFLRPDQYKSLQTSTAGELTGVGLQITRDASSKALRVIAPIKGSPSEMAGIKSRDLILQIDGIPTSELSLDEAAEKMRGPVGSHVVLTMMNDVDETRDIDITRDHISLNPVTFDLKSDGNGFEVGYIRLSQFNANATEAIANAIETLENKGANAFVLDLRNNPGGLLQAGIETTKFWLDQGVIVYTVNRYGIQDRIEAYGNALTNLPLAVLVNAGTASASEILSGALQDNGRAILVGEKTFGKGLIQSLFNLSDGSGLAVTVAKYETPNHSDINKLGIQPDVVVSSELIDPRQVATESDTQYLQAIRVLKESSEALAAATVQN